MELEEGTKIQVLAPVVRGRKGEFVKQLEGYQKDGFVRARIDGEIYDLGEDEINQGFYSVKDLNTSEQNKVFDFEML